MDVMDGFFKGALDSLEKSVVEPLQSAAIEMVDESLNEFPRKDGITSVSKLSSSPAKGFPKTANQHIGVSGQSGANIGINVNFWQEFNLEVKRSQWVETLERLQKNQEASTRARKRLEERARKAREEGTGKGIPASVWMSELDALTGRATSAEHTLSDLITLLSGAPDPRDVMAETEDQLRAQEKKVKELQEEMQGDHAELASMKDLHERFQLLEARNADLEAQLARQTSESRVAEAAELSAEWRRQAEAAREREADITRQLERSTATITNLKERVEVSESGVLAAQAALEVEVAARVREQEEAVQEIDTLRREGLRETHQLQEQIQALEQRLETAAAAVAAGANGPGPSRSVEELDDADEDASLSGETARLAGRGGGTSSPHDPVITSQKAMIDQLREERVELEQRREREHADLTAQVARLTAELDHRTAERDQRPTQDQVLALQRRVAVLESLVDLDEAEELQQESASGEGSETAGTGADSLSGVQVALKGHNRNLTSQLTTARRLLSERDQQLEECQSQCAVLTAEAQTRQHLIQRLEQDLAVLNTSQRSGGVAGDPTSPLGGGARGAGGAHADTWEPGRVVEDITLTTATQQQEQGEGSQVSEASLLDIVVAQRNRFRSRVSELEEEAGVAADRLAEVEKEKAAAKADAVQLFEKLRFMEGYCTSQVAAAWAGGAHQLQVDDAGVRLPQQNKASRYSCGPFAVQVEEAEQQGGRGGGGTQADPQGVLARRKARYTCLAPVLGGAHVTQLATGSGSGAEERARQAYEERLNPFTEFHRREEEQARTAGLRLHDRVTLSGGKLLLGSKWARVFIFMYTIALHMFVLSLLYASSGSSTSTNC